MVEEFAELATKLAYRATKTDKTENEIRSGFCANTVNQIKKRNAPTVQETTEGALKSSLRLWTAARPQMQTHHASSIRSNSLPPPQDVVTVQSTLR